MKEYRILCYFSGMLVGELYSELIPRVGETIFVGNLENCLLTGKSWEVLHIDYAYSHSPGIDSDLAEISMQLIESTKTFGNIGLLKESEFDLKKAMELIAVFAGTEGEEDGVPVEFDGHWARCRACEVLGLPQPKNPD